MSSNDTDRRDRVVRERAIDAALAADRAGRARLIREADEPPPTSHGGGQVPGTTENGRPAR